MAHFTVTLGAFHEAQVEIEADTPDEAERKAARIPAGELEFEAVEWPIVLDGTYCVEFEDG